MHIVFSGGGTAGHINPAIALAEEVRRQFPFAEISFIGTPGGMEKELVAKAGFPLYEVNVMGFQRKITGQNLRAAVLALTSVRRARRLLARLRPGLVVGTGGYACWPALRAAVSLGIPTALHESNAAPGLTVRRLEKRADLVLLNFAESAAQLSHPERAHVVGNPLRRAFTGVTREEARRRLGVPQDAFLLVSFGGSQGAEAINRAAVEVMRHFSSTDAHVYHAHSVGMRNAEAAEIFLPFTQAYAPRLRAERYLHEMPLWLTAADLAVCRAGAMTLSELALAGCPAILVPSPHVAEDHQTKNARAFAAHGAALLLPEDELTGARLLREVTALYRNEGGRRRMALAASSLAKPHAAEDAVRLLAGAIHR